ncbi:MAG: hypothetical protein O7F76_08685 [Planctomycetota bacterium]|nr:hypothetical protein [Planctomycetota bacterium]
MTESVCTSKESASIAGIGQYDAWPGASAACGPGPPIIVEMLAATTVTDSGSLFAR